MHRDIHCRRALAGAVFGFLALTAATLNVAQAQDVAAFPSRPIHLVNSSTAGGLTDVVARVLGEGLLADPAQHGQPVVVDNRPGASGTIAALIVAKAPADGYTLLIADLTNTAINPALMDNPPYDTLRDFAPVSLIGTTPFFLAVASATGVSQWREFAALARSRPGGLSYGSSGSGSIHHLAAETLKKRLGLDMVHVPYKSSGQSTPALVAGDIQVLFTAYGAMAPHLRAGKARLLAVAGTARSAQAPDVPTFTELGVKDMVFTPSVHALAPAGTPAPILNALSAAIRRALQTPVVARRFEALGIDPVGSTPEQHAQQLEADKRFYADAVRQSGARPE
jgi:tripartite-type tricarboxylate transporter receptor subunit TctC